MLPSPVGRGQGWVFFHLHRSGLSPQHPVGPRVEPEGGKNISVLIFGARPVAVTSLRRTLTLPMVVLYGLGVTIGAGIYVLVGQAAGRAGMSAPLSFIVAGLIMICPAASFAELAGRLPFA